MVVWVADEGVFELGFRMDGDFGHGRARQSTEELTRPQAQIAARVDVIKMDEFRHALGIVGLDFVVKPTPKQIFQRLSMDVSANRYHDKSDFLV